MDKILKIVWYCPYPLELLTSVGLKMTRPTQGHTCSWIVNWAAALAVQPGIDLHIITYASRIRRSQSVKYAGYTVHVIRDAIPFTDKSWAGLMNGDAWTGFYARKRRLIATGKKLKPDLVHGHGTEDAFGLTAVQSGVPAVVSIQGIAAEYQRTNPQPRNRAVIRTEIATIRKGHYFMCRTHFDKRFVNSLNSGAKIFHMPEPMNPSFFNVDRSNADATRILFVGGFDPRKGLEQLLLSVASLKPRFRNIRLDVVGSSSPDRKEYLVGFAKARGILDNITFHGHLSQAEIAALHAKATVFAITSQIENSPNSLAEALCAGTPCVAFNVGGISSMFIDGKSGLLVPAGDYAKLADRISILFLDPGLRQRLSESSCRDGIVNHPNQVATATVKAYRLIMAFKQNEI